MAGGMNRAPTGPAGSWRSHVGFDLVGEEDDCRSRRAVLVYSHHIRANARQAFLNAIQNCPFVAWLTTGRSCGCER